MSASSAAVEEKNYPYELTISLKKGTVRGGGLSNSSHVVTSIDGIEIHKSEDSPSPPHWNAVVSKKLLEIQRVDPIMLGFSVYKKRWTAPGYKLVGSTQFPMSELLPILNKGAMEKEIQLNTNRLNLTLSGTLVLGLELKEVQIIKINEDNSDENEEPFTWNAFIGKWKQILTTSKRPINAIIINMIHDIAAFCKYIGRYDNPFFGNLVKLCLLICLTIYVIFIIREKSYLNHKVTNIENSFSSMISQLKMLKT
jgi:hypothetical protein